MKKERYDGLGILQAREWTEFSALFCWENLEEGDHSENQCRRFGNIEMNLTEIIWETVELIYRSHHRDHSQDRAKTV